MSRAADATDGELSLSKTPAETCHTIGLQKRVSRVSVGEENPPESARMGAMNGPLTFEDFVAQHGRRLVGLAYALAANQNGAEDLVHDAPIARYHRDASGRMDACLREARRRPHHIQTVAEAITAPTSTWVSRATQPMP